MDRPVLGSLNCPCELSIADEEQRCWCKVGYINDSTRERLLSGPFYKHPFEVSKSIKLNCFTETVIVNMLDKQLATVSDSQILYYSFPIRWEQLINLTDKNFSGVGHHCYQPISKHWKGMQDLKLMCAVKLLENNPHFETITEEIPKETSETNLTMKYEYRVEVCQNSHNPYMKNSLKITIVLNLDTLLLFTENDQEVAQTCIFKKQSDSGHGHVLKPDKQLMLPYDLLAKRHPPFTRIPYNDAELRIVYPIGPYPFLTSINTCLSGLLTYVLMLEHGSHNLLPFSSTSHKFYPRVFLN